MAVYIINPVIVQVNRAMAESLPDPVLLLIQTAQMIKINAERVAGLISMMIACGISGNQFLNQPNRTRIKTNSTVVIIENPRDCQVSLLPAVPENHVPMF